MTIEPLGVAGAGTMGGGIAQLACLGGYEARLWDPAPDALGAGAERVRADLERARRAGAGAPPTPRPPRRAWPPPPPWTGSPVASW
jgi:3-hydroxyacyl-CoA dehydrogenase